MTSGEAGQGRRTWIIGASAGIGAALAQRLAEDGEVLALSARSAQALDAVLASLPSAPGVSHVAQALDVTDPDSVRAAQEAILQHWGQIDRVIFLAGVYDPMPLTQLDLAQCKTMLDVNLGGALTVIACCLEHLLSVPNSQLAICASVSGYRGLPRAQPYGATKAALINLTESLRAEVGNRCDIRLINPGFVETRLTDKNDFAMPMRQTPQQAADAIAKGLNGRRFEIHFPWLFTNALKLLASLPYWLYFRIVSR